MQEDRRVVLPAADWELLRDALRDHMVTLSDLADHVPYVENILKEARRVVEDRRTRLGPNVSPGIDALAQALQHYDAYLASTPSTLGEIHERAQRLTRQRPEPKTEPSSHEGGRKTVS